jgi:hypothetical protein
LRSELEEECGKSHLPTLPVSTPPATPTDSPFLSQQHPVKSCGAQSAMACPLGTARRGQMGPRSGHR